MLYKVIAWKGGLIRQIIKSDKPENVNDIVRMFKKTDADFIEVYKYDTLFRLIFSWEGKK